LRIVIFRHTPIGDTLIAFPILRELRTRYKEDHITFLGNPPTLPLAQAWGLADEVNEVDQNLAIELYSDEGIRTPEWLNLFQQTDLAISLNRNRTDELIRNLHTAGAKEVIAANEFRSENTSQHAMERLAESIGIYNLAADQVAAFTMKDNEFDFINRPIAIHAGRGKHDIRCWPAASYAALVHRLIRLERPVVLLAGPDDMEQLREVLKRLPSSLRPGMVSVMKNAPLVKVAQMITQSRCYLGTDCGITHLAALTGVPVVALFGPAYPLPPLGPRIELIKDRLERLSVDRVLASIQKYV
jgi:ADP-heptose:LPS heptosyltransferase